MPKPMDSYNKPPPDNSIINRIIKVGGRPLPGMVSSSSVPKTDQQSEEEEPTVQDNNVDCMGWRLPEESWKEPEHPNGEEDDAKAFSQKAENLKKALYVLDRLLRERGIILQDHIKVLQEVADKTDKEVEIASITVGALGLAAVFAPLSRRACLAVAAFTALGISATIINKIYTRKKVEKKLETVLKKHTTYLEEIEKCVKCIGSIVDGLKK